MPNTDFLDEETMEFQEFLLYKIRRIREIGDNEYTIHRQRYDNIFFLEWKQLQKKVKNNTQR